MKRLVENEIIYDLIGVGIGPFNLGLAALSEPLTQIKTLFLEQNDGFDWHPGLLLNNTTLQVPYLADLVTFADPTSRYSFLNYLKEHNRLYKFYFYENFFILRPEYNHYCQWVSSELKNIQFKTKVLEITQNIDRSINANYSVKVMDTHTQNISVIYTKHISLGVGTSPHIPGNLTYPDSSFIFHAAEFLNKQPLLSNVNNICVIGSGQSAAEIVLELLSQSTTAKRKINWITRSNGFFPMEYSKLGLEHFSPDYMNLFYDLNDDMREQLISRQDMMYKGISKNTIADIFDLLYQLTIANKEQPLNLQANTSLNSIIESLDSNDSFSLNLHNHLLDTNYIHNCDAVILATGYKSREMNLLKPMTDILQSNNQQEYILNKDFSLQTMGSDIGKIFMQNNSMNSHGIGSPDLGLGCYRNSVILNSILGCEIYTVQERNVFQDFNNSQLGIK